MTPAEQLEALRQAAVNAQHDEALCGNALRRIAIARGYTAAVEAAQRTLRSLAAEMREEGGHVSVEGWIG